LVHNVHIWQNRPGIQPGGANQHLEQAWTGAATEEAPGQDGNWRLRVYVICVDMAD
jgi:hypothetical protein